MWGVVLGTTKVIGGKIKKTAEMQLMHLNCMPVSNLQPHVSHPFDFSFGDSGAQELDAMILLGPFQFRIFCYFMILSTVHDNVPKEDQLLLEVSLP